MQTTPTTFPTQPTSPQTTAPRRTWLGMALFGLLTARTAQAQMSGGMGGGHGGPSGRGGSPDGAKCGAPAAEPVSTTLVKIYAGERLRSLPAELKLAPELMPLYERYAQALQKLMLDESKWSARPAPGKHPMASIGAQIDLASNRAAGWEEVLEAVKPLYARLDTTQQALADKRLVVSLEPNAWALPSKPNTGTPEGRQESQ